MKLVPQYCSVLLCYKKIAFLREIFKLSYFYNFFEVLDALYKKYESATSFKCVNLMKIFILSEFLLLKLNNSHIFIEKNVPQND